MEFELFKIEDRIDNNRCHLVVRMAFTHFIIFITIITFAFILFMSDDGESANSGSGGGGGWFTGFITAIQESVRETRVAEVKTLNFSGWFAVGRSH